MKKSSYVVFEKLFSEDCENFTDPYFLLFNHFAPYFPTVMNCSSHSLMLRSTIPNKAFINLPSGIVLNEVEKSKHNMDITLPWLLRLFLEFIAGSLFNIVQKDFIPLKKCFVYCRIEFAHRLI